MSSHNRPIAATQESDAAWRMHWIVDICQRARNEVPLWIREIEARQETVAATETIASFPAISAATPKRFMTTETGPVRIAAPRTVMLSAIKLLFPDDIRPLADVISSAVVRFYEAHGFLPQIAEISAMRYLFVERGKEVFFPLNDRAASVGCYTIAVRVRKRMTCDGVYCIGRRYVWEEQIGELHL